jgi:hypothetical protein
VRRRTQAERLMANLRRVAISQKQAVDALLAELRGFEGNGVLSDEAVQRGRAAARVLGEIRDLPLKKQARASTQRRRKHAMDELRTLIAECDRLTGDA